MLRNTSGPETADDGALRLKALTLRNRYLSSSYEYTIESGKLNEGATCLCACPGIRKEVEIGTAEVIGELFALPSRACYITEADVEFCL